MKKYILQGIIIFISLILISNSLSFSVTNSAPNSINFDGVPLELYQSKVNNTDYAKSFVDNFVYNVQNGKAAEAYESLTDDSKKVFNSDAEYFKKEILSKYIGESASVGIENYGVNKDKNMFVFRLKVGLPPVATDEMIKNEAYKEKFIYVAVYRDANDKYTIEWDYNW